MRYTTRKNTEGMKEVVFNLAEHPLLSAEEAYVILCEIAVREFAGIPPIMQFFNMETEGGEKGVISLKPKAIDAIPQLWVVC